MSSTTTASFEVLPFRTDGEAQSEEVRRRMGGISARSPGAIRHGPGLYHGPYRPYRGLRRPVGGYDRLAVPGAAPDYMQAPTDGAAFSEQIRWVQAALNQIMNAGLPTDGVASPDFRAALRNFQGQQGLPVSGFVGPDTVAALRRASGSELEWGWENMVAKVDPNLPQRTYAARLADKFDIALENGEIYDAGTIHLIRKAGGLYRITFKLSNLKEPGVYIGVALKTDTTDIRNRIRSHFTGAREMGCDVKTHVIKVLYDNDTPKTNPSTREPLNLSWYIKYCTTHFTMAGKEHPLKSLEYAIHDLPHYYDHTARTFRAHVTNSRRELESLYGAFELSPY